jgi:hypothetical protein
MTTFVGTALPAKPIAGQMRFNADTNNMELYNGTYWHVIDHTNYVGEYSLEIDEGRVYGARYFTVQPINAADKWNDMMSWMLETFGPSADDGVWTPGMRWYANNAKFWFRNKKDLDWFVLRWSS